MFCSVLLEKMLVNKNLSLFCKINCYVQSDSNSPERFQNIYWQLRCKIISVLEKKLENISK